MMPKRLLSLRKRVSTGHNAALRQDSSRWVSGLTRTFSLEYAAFREADARGQSLGGQLRSVRFLKPDICSDGQLSGLSDYGPDQKGAGDDPTQRSHQETSDQRC
jgi:hypothetical protein